jgi:ligand-binding sensor domain-containing protein/signal transduction histidine kinase
MRFAEFILRIALGFCLVFGSQLLFAQSDFNARLWQAEDGLPNNIVQAIAQTPDGYLWAGTREGLARFDGEQFRLVDFPAQSTQPSVACLLCSRDDSLWVGTEDTGIFRLYQGKWQRCDVPGGNDNFSVYAMHEGSDGSIWFETTRGILRWRHEKMERDPRFGNVRHLLCADNAGQVWLLDGNLKRVDSSSATNYLSESDVLPRSARSFYCDREGVFWIGTDSRSGNSLIQVKDGVATSYPRDNGPAGFVSVMLSDHAGELWVGSYSGLSRFINGKFVKLSEPDESSYRIYAIFEDREQNLWVGSEQGLVRLTPKRFKTITKKDGLSLNTVVAVCPSRDGSVWISSWGGGLNHYQNGKITVLNKTNGLESNFIMAITEAQDGSLWAGADYGGPLHRIQDGIVSVYGPKQGFIVNPMTATVALYEDERGVLWIGGRDALQTWDGIRFTRFTTRDGLSNNTINALCGGPEGTVWIGTGAGLTRWQDGKFENLAAKDPRLHRLILSLYQDPEKTLWIGTKGHGLLRWRDGVLQEFTSKNGLFSDSIYSILEDGHANLWLNSSRGIFRLNKQQIEAVAEGKQKTVTSISYGRADGILASGQYRDVTQPAACKDTQGRLWFRTTQGVVMVNPETVSINDRPPPVVIEEIIADDRPITTGEWQPESAQPLVLPPSRGELEIQYAALSYRAPEKNLYRYKLEGVDSDWVNAGNRRVTKYDNLHPGRYRFQVTAGNNDGVWNEQGQVVELILEPHFWQTAWFFSLLGAAAIGIVAGTARYITRRRMQRRLTQLEKRHAVEQERTRIARDVHDELGAKLTRISFQGGIAKCSLHHPAEAERQIEQMSASAREAVSSLHEIVWAADPVNDSLEGLVGHISHHAGEFFSVSGISCEVIVPEQIPRRHISAGMRHNLFLAVKEAANNAAKHAQATRVLIRIFVRPAELEILVSDNGSGFETEALVETGSDRSKRAGHGLINMRERLSTIQGRCEINSEKGQGTTIRFVVPLGDNGI